MSEELHIVTQSQFNLIKAELVRLRTALAVGAQDAMAAGYAQGVENAEARASKRISELEAIAEKSLDPEYMKNLTESEIVVSMVKRIKVAESALTASQERVKELERRADDAGRLREAKVWAFERAKTVLGCDCEGGRKSMAVPVHHPICAKSMIDREIEALDLPASPSAEPKPIKCYLPDCRCLDPYTPAHPGEGGL